MESNAKFEGEVLALLHRLTAKKEQLQAQYTRELADLDRQIEAVQTTAQLMREPPASGNSTAIVTHLVPAALLRGKSVRAACVEIAKQNQGVLKISDATRVLVNSGVIRNKKHAWGATYTTCARSKEFEKDATIPGTFRLVGFENTPQQPLLQ